MQKTKAVMKLTFQYIKGLQSLLLMVSSSSGTNWKDTQLKWVWPSEYLVKGSAPYRCPVKYQQHLHTHLSNSAQGLADQSSECYCSIKKLLNNAQNRNGTESCF